MPPKKARSPKQKTSAGVRIIAGTWRSRRLSIANCDTLRPTPDRVRETLFNWLAPSIEGAACLDLFAGSGILSFEALSRGAAQAWILEKQKKIWHDLTQAQQLLNAEQAHILNQDCMHFLNTPPPEQFDIVFIDPPYAENLINRCCSLLNEYQWLKPKALVYMEFGNAFSAPEIPSGWKVLRKKTASTVNYWLLQAK